VVDLLDMLTAPDAPYEISLDTKEGDTFDVAPPWPKVKVVSSQEAAPAQLFLQMFEMEAARDGEEPQKFAVGRLVALTAGGVELEINREVLPVLETEDGPTVEVICPACTRKILQGQTIKVHEDRAYHGWCIR